MQLRDDSKKGRRFLIPVEQQQGLTQPGKQMFYGELPALFLGAAAAPTHSRL